MGTGARCRRGETTRLLITTWCEEAAEFAAGLFDLLFGRKETTTARNPAVDRTEQDVNELLDEFRDKADTLAQDSRRAFTLLGEIPTAIRWRTGLRREVSGVIEAAVHEAERFGSGTGPKKRAFAIDLVVRVLQRYNLNGLPFLPPFDEVLIKPVVGVIIDWSVEVLNIHGAWTRPKVVRFPKFYQGAHGKWLKILVWIWSIVLAIKNYLFFPSKYERQIRDAVNRMEPRTAALISVLPPRDLHSVIERLATIIAELGHVTAPYVRLIDQILRVGRELQDLSPSERVEVAFRVLRELVLTAYADEPLALDFLDSSMGDWLLRSMVHQVDWTLQRNGLLPAEA